MSLFLHIYNYFAKKDILFLCDKGNDFRLIRSLLRTNVDYTMEYHLHMIYDIILDDAKKVTNIRNVDVIYN